MENFVDYVKICCRSGKGGNGAVHFRREKYVPKGGPDGGDGGRGGSIIIRGNKQMWTLLHLKYQKHVIATDGRNGMKSNMSGAEGQDVVLDVPLGTIAKDFESQEVLCEIMEEGQEFVLVEGGKGGVGNSFFKSSTNQTPRHAKLGMEGKEEWKILELKVLADVGLVGFPNSGKSTLLSVLSAAKPKIANYPFTTLKPNLGIIKYRDFRSFVMADIPGIIENAHLGKGLGHRFLKHIERNSILLYVIPVDSENILKEYEILRSELENFNPELLHKKHLVTLTKSDLIDDELKELIIKDLPSHLNGIFISSVAQIGLDSLKDKLWDALQEVNA